MGKNIQYSEDNEEEFDISADDIPPQGGGGGGFGGGGKNDDKRTFPPGEHPLDGIPGVSSADLPAPDPLPSTAAEGYPLDLIGAYLVRCLLSKNWNLREAALTKVCILISNEAIDISASPQSVAQLCTLIKGGLNDKISQVVLTSFDILLECVTTWSDRGLNVTSREYASHVDSALNAVLAKFGDANLKVRGEAQAIIAGVAELKSVGPAHVARLLCKEGGAPAATTGKGGEGKPAPAPKDGGGLGPKPLAARLQVLAEIVSKNGVTKGEGGGLSLNNVMNFVKATNSFAHTAADVRGRAKDLTVLCVATCGEAAVDKWLSGLRPKQLEEYQEAFRGGGSGGGDDGYDDEPVPVVVVKKQQQTKAPAAAAPAKKGKEQQPLDDSGDDYSPRGASVKKGAAMAREILAKEAAAPKAASSLSAALKAGKGRGRGKAGGNSSNSSSKQAAGPGLKAPPPSGINPDRKAQKYVDADEDGFTPYAEEQYSGGEEGQFEEDDLPTTFTYE